MTSVGRDRGAAGPGTIVVADGIREAREFLGRLIADQANLRLAGLAATGTEAVDAAERLRPDLVLMDLHMPELDGLRATREIIARFPGMAVVVMSIDGTAERVAAAREVGAVGYLVKPFSADELMASIGAALSRGVPTTGNAEVNVQLHSPCTATGPNRSPTPPSSFWQIRRAVKEGRAQIKDYRFPDHPDIVNVTLQTALIDGRSNGRLLGKFSQECWYSEDEEGDLPATHEIDVTTDYVDLATVTDLPHRVAYIDRSEDVRNAFVRSMARRAMAGWKDDDCSRRGAYEARAAAGRARDREARLAEAEAELRDERTHSERWQLIAIILAVAIVVILVTHPYLIGL